MYKVTMMARVTKYSGSNIVPGETPTKEWLEEATVTGDAQVVAGAMRAYADKIDPKR